MINLLYSCFDKVDPSIKDDLNMLLVEADNYKKHLKVPDVLHDTEIEYIEFLIKNYDMAGKFPSYTLFCQNYPDAVKSFTAASGQIQIILPNDMRNYIFQVIDARVNDYISRRIDSLNKVAGKVEVDMSNLKNNRIIEIVLEKIQNKEVVEVVELHSIIKLALDEVDYRVAQAYRKEY